MVWIVDGDRLKAVEYHDRLTGKKTGSPKCEGELEVGAKLVTASRIKIVAEVFQDFRLNTTPYKRPKL